MTFASASIAAVCLVSLAAYFYLRNVYSYWSKKGIKGPKPLPFLGNFLDLLSNDRVKLEQEWMKKYGKVYGTYVGVNPRLNIADAEILNQISIKDFDYFPNHYFPEFSSKYSDLSLIKLQDEHWRRTRAIVTPTFTSGKIKRMFKLMNVCSDDLIRCYGEQFSKFYDDNNNSPSINGESNNRKAVVNVKDIYTLSTMDSICSCIFSIKLDRGDSSTLKQMAGKNEILAKLMRMFHVNIFRTALNVCTPDGWLNKLNFKSMPNAYIEPMAEVVRKIIESRRNNVNGGKKFDDYLQTIINARLDDKMELNNMDSLESHHVGLTTNESMLKHQEEIMAGIGTKEAAKKTLTDEEIIAGTMFILATGLETTGSLLAHCTYALAYYPEVQEKLYKELMGIVEFDLVGNEKMARFEYEALTSAKYLDAVLSETLRALPPVYALDRRSSQHYYMEKYDLHLPKGSVLLLNFYGIHHDPDNWPEPERFDPERFMPGNREKIPPGAYCPFGVGPRHCPGMRFALTEAKLFLAKMVLNYKFEPAPGVKYPPEHRKMVAVLNLKAPHVTLMDRIPEEPEN